MGGAWGDRGGGGPVYYNRIYEYIILTVEVMPCVFAFVYTVPMTVVVIL